MVARVDAAIGSCSAQKHSPIWFITMSRKQVALAISHHTLQKTWEYVAEANGLT